jgi:hypothetical protein
MSSAPIKPLTVSEFDFTKLSIGGSRENTERGFTKHYLNYNRDNLQDNKAILKISAKILGVYPPNDGSYKNGMLCIIDDVNQIKLLNDIESHVLKLALEHNKEWFDDATLEKEDIDCNYNQMVKHNDTYKNTSFTVNFPFMTDEVKDPVTLQYLEGCGEPTQEMIDSNNLVTKLPRGSVVDIFLHFTNILVQNGSNDFNIQRTIFKRINVKTLGSQDGMSSNGPRPGMNIDEIDVSNIFMGEVITNERQGRSLKPKYQYTTTDGEKKLRSLSVNLKDVPVSFRRQVDDTGKSSFSVVYRLNEDHLDKFSEIDEYLKQQFHSDFTKYESGKKITKKMLDKKFKGAVKHSDEYPSNMWYSVYAVPDGDGFDFKDNFYKPNGSTYSNDDILNDIFGNNLTCELNVYLKHIWFVSSKGTYSAKFNVGSVVVDSSTIGVVYDLGDAHVDTIKSASNSTSDSKAEVEVEEEEHVSSNPEDSSDVPSEEED